MIINKNYKIFSYFLIFLSISSFFAGFIYGENSAGAGTLDYDFKSVWKNLQTFLANDINKAIELTAVPDHEYYQSSRTPLLYILHKLFNPFIESKVLFVRSVFVFSLSVPILFYLCLKQKYKNEENLLIILISSTVCLSPYFRTSAYWGLEENFGLVSLLLSFLFLSQFLSNNNSSWKNYYKLFLAVLFSSACLYFDQKLAIIPLICFFKIILSEKDFRLKIFSIFLYFIFSLPFIYLIMIWGSLLPPADTTGRGIWSDLYFSHIGYSMTIIAFYLFPFLFFKKRNLINNLKDYFENKKNYYMISLFFIYLFYLIIFYDLSNEVILGKGLVYKTAITIFENRLIQEIFIYFAFFISWLIILFYVNDNLKDKLILFYFFVLSIIIWPLLQEYFDPLIILMVLIFFNSKLFFNYKNSIFLHLYLFIFLISANIYYFNLFN